MLTRSLYRSLVPLAFGLIATNSSAALVTVSGTMFDLTYDDAALGGYGTPTLVGNLISFVPTIYTAESQNGNPATALDLEHSTINLQLSVHNGFRFDSVQLNEGGNYVKNGSESLVGVSGHTIAWDLAQGLGTQVMVPLQAGAPFDITNPAGDFSTHAWSASASSDLSSNTFAGTKDLSYTIQNLLFAFTSPNDPDALRNAFIEKRSVSVAVGIQSVSPVPEPEVWAMMLVGVGLVGFRLRRKSKRTSASRFV